MNQLKILLVAIIGILRSTDGSFDGAFDLAFRL